MEVEISGYTDVRTGEYKEATEANREEVLEDIGFMMAWKFYWDGPATEDHQPIYDRKTWLVSDRRRTWLAALNDEQRDQLFTAPPPEEVPSLVPQDEPQGQQ